MPRRHVGFDPTSLYGALRIAIIDGEYCPGAVLQESALAERFNVSRTPIREALRRLEQDGIVERVGRQLRVTITTPEEVFEIYDCRVALEGMAAARAARARTDWDIARLMNAMDRMRTLESHVPSDLAAANHEFHISVWDASHNRTLVDLLARLDSHILRYPEPTVSQPGRWPEVIEEHEAILDAIVAGEAADAERAATRHMQRARDVRLKALANARPDLETNVRAT